MACSHKSCTCQIKGCGTTHLRGWKPKIMRTINGVEVGGDDPVDCMAHYLLQAGYPTDQPHHLRKIAESMADTRLGRGYGDD